VGGLVMPIILKIEYVDGSSEELRIPAEIWRRDPQFVSKLVVTDKEVTSIVVDPKWETADVDIENNYYPRRIIPSRIESFKSSPRSGLDGRDLMEEIKTELKTDDEDDEASDEDNEAATQ